MYNFQDNKNCVTNSCSKKAKIEETFKELENKSKNKQSISFKFLEKYNDMFPKNIEYEIIQGNKNILTL